MENSTRRTVTNGRRTGMELRRRQNRNLTLVVVLAKVNRRLKLVSSSGVAKRLMAILHLIVRSMASIRLVFKLDVRVRHGLAGPLTTTFKVPLISKVASRTVCGPRRKFLLYSLILATVRLLVFLKVSLRRWHIAIRILMVTIIVLYIRLRRMTWVIKPLPERHTNSRKVYVTLK